MPKFVMVDLETLGTVPGCTILSIGAVEVDIQRGTLGKEFYIVVNRDSCSAVHLSEDKDTLAWWQGPKNTPESRRVLTEAGDKKKSVPIKLALEKFNKYLLGLGTLRDIRLLGNGADFDNPILRVAYDCAGVAFMGSKAGFFGGRCYRTLKGLDEIFGPAFAAPKLVRQGTYHNALDDAKSQALHLIDIVAAVRGK